jgi:hypothetical protein
MFNKKEKMGGVSYAVFLAAMGEESFRIMAGGQTITICET